MFDFRYKKMEYSFVDTILVKDLILGLYMKFSLFLNNHITTHYKKAILCYIMAEVSVYQICNLKLEGGDSIQNVLQGISTSHFPYNLFLKRVTCGTQGCQFPKNYTLHETFIKSLQSIQSLLGYKLCST